MANNLMRIKRSTTAATPGTALSNGELAYSYSSNSLFIGAQTGPGVAGIQIGGSKYSFLNAASEGVLTSSATIVTEANSFVSNLFSVGLYVGPSRNDPTTNTTHAHITRISPEVSASGGTSLGGLAGSTGSNAELVTSYAIKQYVDQKVASGGSFSNGLSYIWSATQQFNENVHFDTAVLSVGNTTANVTVNTTVIVVGNGTVSATINSTAFSGTAANVTGVIGYSSLPANVVIWSNTNTFSAVQTFNQNVVINTNSTTSLTVGNTTVNNFTNATHHVVSNSTVSSTLTIGSLTTPAVTIGGQITANATLMNLGTVANLHAASANATFQNMVVSGNLTVSGTTTTIDTTNLNVKDNVILLANGNQAVTTDAVDSGVVSVANTGGTTYYGYARIAGTANTFRFFSTTTVPGTTISSPSTMHVQAYLRPFGANNEFVVNATSIRIAANSTVVANIIANTLSLSTPLPIGSGGTGQSTYSAGDLLVGGAGSLSRYAIVATEGLVLQVNASSLPQWDTLDGGTF